MPVNFIDIFNEHLRSMRDGYEAGDSEKCRKSASKAIEMAISEIGKGQNFQSDYIKSQAQKALSYMLSVKSQTALVSESGDDPNYSERQWFTSDAPNLSFKDIIGVQEVKDAFMVNVVAAIKPQFSELYRKFRGNEKGTQILLYGPPGTGKTHIVKCLAGALQCKIAVVNTSEVLASLVGVAEKNFRDIFKQAESLDKCIIFFDEIDSICSDRSDVDSRNTKSVLTTLLTCMDGFMKTNTNQVRIIIAATNLPWKLDSAIKRGGRFETQIYVPLPDYDSRVKFVKKSLDKLPHDDDVTSEMLAKKLDGYSGADINAVMRQIANRPLKREIENIVKRHCEKGERVTQKDCEEVLKTYINSINQEMLDRFTAYDKNLTYEEYRMQKR